MSFAAMKNEFTISFKESFEKNNIDILHKLFVNYKINDVDKRSGLDQILRDMLLNHLSDSYEDVTHFEGLVTFCIEMCTKEMCSATLPVVLLGDIFDSVTLDDCEKLFKFVECNVNIWKRDMFFSSCKNNLLRMCNDLLRRLSRSQNTIFCGRILLFLAKFFPFSERSGLNIVSEFNLDNITEFGIDESKGIDIQIKDEPMDEDDFNSAENKIKIDFNLYCKFWALQDFFRNPNQCYNKVSWKTFSNHASNVLSTFNSFKLEAIQSKKMKMDKVTLNKNKEAQHYFAKFLTNQKLLELQLSDSNFRRYVLLQFLIVFQYLNSPVKFKSENYELKQDQSEWIKETTETIYKLLGETPPDGPAFVQTVKHILKREEHWNSWKNDGCPEFQKPIFPSNESNNANPTEAESTNSTETRPVKRNTLRAKRNKRSIGEIMKESANNNKFFMGNSELTKLWNLNANNLDSCKTKERDFLPSLEEYFEESIQQANPEAMIEDNLKRVNDGNFGWRALRLLARRSPHFFTHINNPINKLPDFLEIMIKKIAKDRPTLAEENKLDMLETETHPNGPEEDDELLKGDEPSEQEVDSTDITEIEQIPSRKFTPELITELAGHLLPDWKRLAHKLGYTPDLIEYFQGQRENDLERATHMLTIWSEDDEDATPENLAYTCEGLGLTTAAQFLSN